MGFASKGISTADIEAALKAGSAQVLRFYGEQADVYLTGSAQTIALGSIAIPNLTGLGAVKHAKVGVIVTGYSQAVSDLNKLDGIQTIQVDTGSAGWLTGLTLDNAMFGVGNAQGSQFIELIGAIDVKAKTAFNQTTVIQWASGKVDTASAYLHVVSFLEIVV